MEKLELKHLAPYLPYNLICLLTEFNDDCFVIGASEDYVYTDSSFDELYYTDIKPILKPLHDLTRGELEKQGFWHHIDWLTYELQTSKRNNGIKGLEKHIKDAPYEMIDYLFSQHYDVFGLIDKGLAISYSDVQSTSNEG